MRKPKAVKAMTAPVKPTLSPAKPAGADPLVEIIEAGGVGRTSAASPEVLRTVNAPWRTRLKLGEALRRVAPFAAHAKWKPAKGRPDPVAILEAGNVGRVPELIPVRMGRMAASPFAFLRGSAAVMAWDLAHGPSTGVNVVIGGDAHIDNFGLFGTPQGDVVIDLNDFDEVTVGPWEWDLKRLTASINVAGRANGFGRKARRKAVIAAVDGYRWSLARLRDMPILDVWRQHTLANRLGEKGEHLDRASAKALRAAVKAAKASNNHSAMMKLAAKDADGGWRIVPAPPGITAVGGQERDQVIAGLRAYLATLAPERQYMLRRYHIDDVADQVVGVGSVGMRVYLVMLMGNGDVDPLFLQIKEAGPPAAAAHVPALPDRYNHEGRRVVFGQRLLQATGDTLLGWTEIAGRSYYVRQMRNRKGSIPLATMAIKPFSFFVWAYGGLLARAHARSGDAAVISGYCGGAGAFDEALADWAEAYGDQTYKDHAALVEAIRSGRVKAAPR